MKTQLEPIFPSKEQSFSARRFSERSFQHPFHHHPQIELTYICSSSGTRIVGDHNGSFRAGDLCLIGKNLPHYYTGASDSSQPAEAFVLQFERELGNGLFDAASEFREVASLLDRCALGLNFDSQTAAKTCGLLATLIEATGPRRWTLLLEILEILLSAPEPKALASPGYVGELDLPTASRIHWACEHVLARFDQPLPIGEVAKLVHVTPAHFSRQFKRATRKTYTQFVTEVRLGHACRLLRESELSILEIAYRSGFNNLSNFNRRFREAYDCSPRKYRRAV